MNLTVDIGNTRVKQAWFDDDRICEAPAASWRAERAIVCATGRCDLDALALPADHVTILSSDTPLPITLDYATPQTLGPDRIAAACGARKYHRNTVIIDAGTCITVDFLDAEGIYRGGAILPGMEMQFRAMNAYTAKLPLVEAAPDAPAIFTGRDTVESMTAGVVTAARFAVAGFVDHYRQRCSDLLVLLTGGDAARLWGNGALEVPGCVMEPQLVMIGLNEILKLEQ